MNYVQVRRYEHPRFNLTKYSFEIFSKKKLKLLISTGWTGFNVFFCIQLGPVEYILYETRRDGCGIFTYDAVSAEDYELIYPIMMCCSFPMNTFQNFHKGN